MTETRGGLSSFPGAMEPIPVPRSRAVVIGAMIRRFIDSIGSLNRATQSVFALLGVGLIAIAATKPSAVTITIAVTGFLAALIVAAWYRSESEYQAMREGYLQALVRVRARTGYSEGPNPFGRTNYAVDGGFGGGPFSGGNGGNGGNGGVVYGEGGSANGGNGGAGGPGGFPGGGGGGGSGWQPQ
ncbi:hypothetical protein [Rhodococcus sp. SORGH_AS_0303]|uniref:hypothetical protein n=1 Tax=Rhodococcus sp. SORGH_AS_0303 TaxID=3041753 RepID=UPI0027851729|nr:hypothetical protein [Rhodococcus sp. SORGH_AS_0303]MDQ1202716.1 hypothetical protein [Rhodococcus sp. SORGH_AS_0303]